LFAIASIALFGTRWVTNSLSEIDVALIVVEAPTSGSGRFSASPGRRRFTMKRPSRSETNEAPTNQARAFAPTRPIDPVSPMFAIPTTSVEKTRGAMIILIRRRKMSLIRLM
jgi:hypothetical protein